MKKFLTNEEYVTIKKIINRTNDYYNLLTDRLEVVNEGWANNEDEDKNEEYYNEANALQNLINELVNTETYLLSAIDAIENFDAENNA